MDRLVADYISYLRIERAMSPNTVSSYSSDVEKFFLAVGKAPSAVTTDDRRYYVSSRRYRSNSCLALALRPLRAGFD